MQGGVGLECQPLVESEEFDIAGFTGSEENEGPSLPSHAGSSPTTMDKGTVNMWKMNTSVRCTCGTSALFITDLEEDGGSNCSTQSTAGKSIPRAITSVHIRTPLHTKNINHILIGYKLHYTPVHGSKAIKDSLSLTMHTAMKREHHQFRAKAGNTYAHAHAHTHTQTLTVYTLYSTKDTALTVRSRTRSSSQKHMWQRTQAASGSE